MPLIKFCRGEHNPGRSGTIRVGTLYSYRQIENPEIEDGDEGRYRFNIQFDGEVRIEKRWANLLFQNVLVFDGREDNRIFAPGRINARVERFHLARVEEEAVVVRDSKVVIEREAINSFIFCMSIGEREMASPFDGYDDKWVVSENSVEAFAKTLGQCLLRQTRFYEYASDPLSAAFLDNVDKVQVSMRLGQVKYIGRDLRVTNETAQDFDRIMSSILDVPFCKPEGQGYEAENEFRIIFDISCAGVILEPQVEFKVLNLNVLNGLMQE